MKLKSARAGAENSDRRSTPQPLPAAAINPARLSPAKRQKTVLIVHDLWRVSSPEAREKFTQGIHALAEKVRGRILLPKAGFVQISENPRTGQRYQLDSGGVVTRLPKARKTLNQRAAELTAKRNRGAKRKEGRK